MKTRPILFSGPMVTAILDGRKTQTRRMVKPQPECLSYDGPPKLDSFGTFSYPGGATGRWKCPYGVVGDRIWVRETTCIAPKRFADPDDTCVTDCDGDKRYVSYKADGHSEDAMRDYKLKWAPSIHMPRWASRITLEIVSIRVERLRDITEEDARKEGCDSKCPVGNVRAYLAGPFSYHFAQLWDSIYGNWDANPFVWVVEFRRVLP